MVGRPLAHLTILIAAYLFHVMRSAWQSHEENEKTIEDLTNRPNDVLFHPYDDMVGRRIQSIVWGSAKGPDARRKIEAWREDYNQRRPHSSLAYRTPAEFARRWSPSPSTTVVEQTGESVKDSLTARKPRTSLTDSPVCSKASDTRVKGKSEGVMI
jgi:hypothetical protein